MSEFKPGNIVIFKNTYKNRSSITYRSYIGKQYTVAEQYGQLIYFKERIRPAFLSRVELYIQVSSSNYAID